MDRITLSSAMDKAKAKATRRRFMFDPGTSLPNAGYMERRLETMTISGPWTKAERWVVLNSAPVLRILVLVRRCQS